MLNSNYVLLHRLWYKSSASIFHGTQTIDFQLCWTAFRPEPFSIDTLHLPRPPAARWASQNPPSTMTLTTSGALTCFLLVFFIFHWNVNTTSCCMCPTFSLRIHLMSHSSFTWLHPLFRFHLQQHLTLSPSLSVLKIEEQIMSNKRNHNVMFPVNIWSYESIRGFWKGTILRIKLKYLEN